MTQESPFNKFLDLIKLDQFIETIVRDNKKIGQEIALLTAQENEATKQLNTSKQKVHDAQKKVDVYELEMKSYDTQEQQKKQRLDLISNHKEYQSLKSEIDLIKKKQNDLEETLIQSWHMLEVAKKEYETIAHTTHEVTTQIHIQLKEKHAELKTSLDKQYEQEALRKEKEQGVPSEWLDKYLMMRARVADPVVPVVHGSCHACFYKISEQDMVLLRRNKLIQCKDCYRFLYIPTPATQSA